VVIGEHMTNIKIAVGDLPELDFERIMEIISRHVKGQGLDLLDEDDCFLDGFPNVNLSFDVKLASPVQLKLDEYGYSSDYNI